MLKVTHVLNLDLLDNKAPALSFTMLPYVGRDDREEKEQRRERTLGLIPGQRTCNTVRSEALNIRLRC